MPNSLLDHFTFPDVTLTTLDEGDLPQLVDFINPAYTYIEKAKGAPRTNLAALTERASEVTFYVAKQGERIVGCVYRDPHIPSLHFGFLTVSEDYRGQGLAPALLEAIEAYAREKHFQSLDLDYMSVAPWLKLYYEKRGFVETGKVEKWDTIDLIHMVKSLTDK